MSIHTSKVSMRKRVRTHRFAETFFIIAAAGLAFTEDAHAYLDPGTGSILIQGLIASVAAGLMVVRAYWARLRNFFKKSPDMKPLDESGNDDPSRSSDG